MKTALLISTYNWPGALNLVLKSLCRQTILPHEILIADDGSTYKTKEVVDFYIKEKKLPIKHIWHEDEGFRRTVILNKAIAVSSSDYIIQLDGDCIMHKNFVEDHIKSSRQKVFLFGSRVGIKQKYLPELFSYGIVDFPFFSGNITRKTRNLHIPFLADLNKEKPGLSKKVRGCNLSFWRADFLKINGYNEEMTGWGKEDSEMVIRLLNNGILGKRLRYKAIIYHIWHKVSSREKEDINSRIQQEAIDKELKFCRNGINKYLEMQHQDQSLS